MVVTVYMERGTMRLGTKTTSHGQAGRTGAVGREGNGVLGVDLLYCPSPPIYASTFCEPAESFFYQTDAPCDVRFCIIVTPPPRSLLSQAYRRLFTFVQVTCALTLLFFFLSVGSHPTGNVLV